MTEPLKPATPLQIIKRTKNCIEYELIAALRRNPVIIMAGDDISSVAADEITKLIEEREKLREALESVLVKEPNWDAHDGPCCYEVNQETKSIRCDGCTCMNSGDTAKAALWAEHVHSWFAEEPLRELLASLEKSNG